MISSTARDLPDHREEVKDACLRQSMFPVMMEHLPASDAEAIAVSLRMVDEADLYLGIFAHRYGYVPQGHPISVTEMEYNRAVERKIPRLIFVMHDDHPITAKDVEKGAGAAKLETFKQRVQTENIIQLFRLALPTYGDMSSTACRSIAIAISPSSTTSAPFPSHPNPTSPTPTPCCRPTG
ncbi:MAG: DUF4062 domain-containing protein [Nitrospira sp.]|nr:DUF4062 domain-containing protein [Nitrospira sp.]